MNRVVEAGRTIIEIEGGSSLIQLGGPGQDGVDGRGVAEINYDQVTGKLTIALSDGSSLVTGDMRGRDGIGIAGTVYDSGSGQVIVTLTDGTSTTTGDLRVKGDKGDKGDVGGSVTVMAYAATDSTGYNAALAAYAADPRVLVIRYA